jgi:hypothetical protein
VLLMIKQKVGVLCTIETRDRDLGTGSIVRYSMEALPGNNMLRVSMSWHKDNNIVYRDPEKSEEQVKGTLSCLVTEFALPPEEKFMPTYRLQMRLRRSMAARLASSLACGGRQKQAETISIDEPLRSHHPVEIASDLVAQPAPLVGVNEMSSPSSIRQSDAINGLRRAGSPPPLAEHHEIDSDGFDDAGEEERGLRTNSREPLLPHGVSRQTSAASWLYGEEHSCDSPEAFVGRLRVRILRARAVPEEACLLALHTPERTPELYATCLLAERLERTQVVAEGGKPEWLEAWTFPVKGQDLRDDIVIELFDNGMYGACDRVDFLGRVTVPVSTALSAAGVVSISEPLHNGWFGSIDLELELLPRCPQFDANLYAEEPCNIEVGSSFSLSTPSPTPAPVTAGQLAPGVSVKGIKVRSASPACGLNGLWCSKACSIEFS